MHGLSQKHNGGIIEKMLKNSSLKQLMQEEHEDNDVFCIEDEKVLIYISLKTFINKY